MKLCVPGCLVPAPAGRVADIMAVMVGSLRDVPFVGRARELEALQAAVADAAGGAPAAVLVAGEAGVGKSRLVRALLADTVRPEVLVLRAQGVDLGEPGLPCLTMADLVRGVHQDPELAGLVDDLPLLAGLLDRNASADGSVGEERRLQLFDAAASLLVEAGRLRGPVVIVIEDVQWVDASSADFLRFLLSRMDRERLVVLATVRTDGLSARPRVRQLLNELGRLPSVRRLDLEPFDAAEVAEFLSGALGESLEPGVAAEVLRQTAGNAFYVQTVAGWLADGGTLEHGLPRALTDLLVGKLDGLTDDARTVVHCAAIVPHDVPDRLLRQVVDLPDADLDEALRAAVAAGVLRPEGAGYAFAHDLLRTAIHDDLLPGVRAKLHAAHAAVLEAGLAGAAAATEVAHHFAQAHDAPKTLAWSVRAAQEAMRLPAPGEALLHLERALAGWAEVDDAAAVAGMSKGRLAVEAARAAGLAGESARALEWAEQALRLCDADGDAAGGVQARAGLVRQLVAVDRAEQAVPRAEEAVRLADEGTAALARVALARALLAARRPDEARPHAERALELARAAGVPGLEVEALTTVAFLDEIAGDRDGAADRLGAAALLARAEREPAAELRAHYTLACLHYYNGDVGGSLPVLRSALTRVNETGLRWSDPGIELRVLQAIALYVSGDLDASLQAAEAPEGRPPDVAAARLAAVSCYAAVARGLPDADGRITRLRESWDTDPQVALVAGGCEADRLTWEGDHAGAVGCVEEAQAHLDAVAGEGMYGGLWLSALALAALADRATSCRRVRDEAGLAAALGAGDVVLERVERILRIGRGRPGDLGPEGRAWHARALAEHARLAGQPAVELWQVALDAYGYGHAYEQARCHWRLAEALVAAGDRKAAKVHAETAAAAADQMQAVPLRRAVAATVSGAALSASALSREAILTEREREVLALVAEGLTNSEIGKRLFISAKTVSVHLSNMMTKLNAASRTEAVTVAHRRGLLDVI